MDATHLARLLRSLATTPSRRGVARALTGFTLAGALTPLLGLPEADAKRRKKKKRRRKKKRRQKEPQPFCAEKDLCVVGDGPQSRCGGGELCICHVTAETGKPFCSLGFADGETCSDCAAGTTCVDLSGPQCGGTVACALPCPDPL